MRSQSILLKCVISIAFRAHANSRRVRTLLTSQVCRSLLANQKAEALDKPMWSRQIFTTHFRTPMVPSLATSIFSIGSKGELLKVHEKGKIKVRGQESVPAIALYKLSHCYGVMAR